MAKPETLPDGSVNLMIWQCTIPGKTGVSSRSRSRSRYILFFDLNFIDEQNFVNYASGNLSVMIEESLCSFIGTRLSILCKKFIKVVILVQKMMKS